jgi:acetyltransferase-like isoleucine patch superfamily enzyme
MEAGACQPPVIAEGRGCALPCILSKNTSRPEGMPTSEWSALPQGGILVSFLMGGKGLPVIHPPKEASVVGMRRGMSGCVHLSRFSVCRRRIRAVVAGLLRRMKKSGSIKRTIIGDNNSIHYDQAYLDSVVIDISGNNNTIEIGESTRLRNTRIFIRGDHHRITLGRNCILNCGGSRWNIWMEDSHCTLVVGDATTMDDVHLALTEPGSMLRIGADCMLSSDIDIRTGDSHSIVSVMSNERINHAKDVTIADHVWIAAHCILLKGSVIPENSVVAAGSVVSHRYKTGGIVIGGNPSSQLMAGITWSRDRIGKPTDSDAVQTP